MFDPSGTTSPDPDEIPIVADMADRDWDEVIPLYEAARELGVEPRLLIKAINKGWLRSTKVGTDGFSILRSDLANYYYSGFYY